MSRPDCQYETCCVHANGDDITEMVDQAIDVTYRTILRHCKGLREWAKNMGYEANSREGLTLQKDWHVSYHRSKYRGKRCYYVQHSGIEHIWVECDG